VRIKLFGSLRISVDGQTVAAVNTNRLHSLIAWLILHGDTPQPRERLAFLLWPASAESQARTNLRQLLHHLKRALPAECTSLTTDYFAVHWRQDESCSIDASEFRTAIEQAERARASNDGAAERTFLTAAAELYEDDLLPGLYDDWLSPIREDYRKRMSHVLHRLATGLEGRKEYAAAIPWAERLVSQDSLNESHHQLLIRLHEGNRDRASALRAYHQCMRTLRRETGVGPGPATVELFERILKTDSSTPDRSSDGAAWAASPAQALIGRRAEWLHIASAWQTATKAGPRTAFISGEPGIGKTRMAEEFYVTCIRQGHSAARSRCYSGQGQLAYAPVAEWLRSDAVRAAWPKLTPQQLVELASLVPEIRETYPDLEQPRPMTEGWRRLHFYESLNAALGKTRKPLLLFIDDLQWCDPESLEWMYALLHSHAAAGVLVLGTVRAEETGRDHPFSRFLAGLRQSDLVTVIPLVPLDAAETADLARTASDEPLGHSQLGEIFRATKGNPLFVLESVRAGLRSTRVHAVIAARLSQLSAPSYELAGLASVVARPFSFELLEKSTDWDEASLSQALDELWQRRIIEGRGAAEYDFTHDRLREVAYAELSVVRQRYWHRRVARALQEVYAADIDNWHGQIASHYEQAGMAIEAIEHYRMAAKHARQRYADIEAADMLRRALGLCRGFPESERRQEQELEMLVTLGVVLVTTEGYSAAEVGETYGHALDLSRRLEDRNIFAILSGAWAFHAVRGDLEKSRQLSLEFLRAAGPEPPPELTLAGNFILGCSLFHMGRLAASLESIMAALRAPGGPGESVLTLFAGPNVGVFCQSYLAHLSWHRASRHEDEAAAHAHMAEALASAIRARHPFSEALALTYMTMLHVFGNESGEALERGGQAVALCSRYGFSYYLAVAKILRGWSESAQGNPTGGLDQLREGLEGMRALHAELRLPFYYALLAETCGRAGMVREGLANLSAGFAFVSKNGEEWAASELHRVQGVLLAADGKSELARASYRRALDAARRSGSLAFERRLAVLLDGTEFAALAERS
jgi:DNA-binding SARP family transcriptional activator/tetratricopeptide (TPR) repeat protein